jgi:hypothetical protein
LVIRREGAGDTSEISETCTLRRSIYDYKRLSIGGMRPIPDLDGIFVVIGRTLTSVVKEREFSAHASPEKGRFAGTAKQAESVNHDARERKAARVDGLPAEIIRHSGG